MLAGGAISDAALSGDSPAVDLQRGARRRGAAPRGRDPRGASVDTAGLTDAPREWLDAGRTRAPRSSSTTGAAAARARDRERPRASPARCRTFARRRSRTPNADTARGARGASASASCGPRSLDERAEADLFEAAASRSRGACARAQTRSGLVDFDGLLVRARDLLRDASDVRAALKRRFRMILVDEFQDTDPIQYEIVFFLAERERRRAPRTRTRRGWRPGACSSSATRSSRSTGSAARTTRPTGARSRHVLDQGGAELSLTSNFRSTAAVLRPVNALFDGAGLVPVARLRRTCRAYEPIEAEREDDGARRGRGLDDQRRPRTPWPATRRRAEGLALAAEVSALRRPRSPWRYDDVLVLFRGFSDLAPYLRALREAAIPFVVSGGRTFFERTEIVQAMAVLRAVADPDDPSRCWRYRRSPAGGVPDTELAARGGRRAAPRRLAAADERLAALRAEAARLPVDAAVRHVLEASGLVALSGLAFEAAQRVANLEKLALAASELARDGRRTLLETLDALEEGFESDEEGDSPLADADRDAVRVMTIHKAKGLEAPVVILADTAAGRSNQRRETLRRAHGPPGRTASSCGSTAPGSRTAAAIAASLDDARHDEAEDVRLLYVALTRARDRLFVFGGGTPKVGVGRCAVASWTVGVTHRTLAARPGGGSTRRPPSAPRTAARALRGRDGGGARARPLRRSARRAIVRRRRCGSPRPKARIEPELARDGGTDRSRAARRHDDPGRRRRARARPRRSSARVRRVAARRALGGARRFSAARCRCCSAKDGARWRGAIDLLYRDRDGTVVVADFKTDASDDGAIERHGEQLRVYVRAVRRRDARRTRPRRALDAPQRASSSWSEDTPFFTRNRDRAGSHFSLIKAVSGELSRKRVCSRLICVKTGVSPKPRGGSRRRRRSCRIARLGGIGLDLLPHAVHELLQAADDRRCARCPQTWRTQALRRHGAVRRRRPSTGAGGTPGWSAGPAPPPSTLTVCRSGSSTIAPAPNGPGGSAPPRRSSARTRASSVRGLNGFAR